MESRRSLLNMVALSGFDRPQDLIHLFVGGSELHGAKVGKQTIPIFTAFTLKLLNMLLAWNRASILSGPPPAMSAATAQTTLI